MPLAYERDIKIIASVTENQELLNDIDTVCDAIREVRSTHLKVSRSIASQVRTRAIERLKEGGHTGELVEITPDIVVVDIIGIDEEKVTIGTAEANRLRENII